MAANNTGGTSFGWPMGPSGPDRCVGEEKVYLTGCLFIFQEPPSVRRDGGDLFGVLLP